MVVLHFHSDLRSTTRVLGASVCLNPGNSKPKRLSAFSRRRRLVPVSVAAALKVTTNKKLERCTADELHYVDVHNSDWRLALWHYLPSPQAPQRNHPLLLLSGVGTNAIGFDLSPEYSFARYMAGQGYDTWTLELRGAGLSTPNVDSGEANDRSNVYHVNGDSKELPIGIQAKEMAFRSGQSQSFNLFDNFAHPSLGEEGKSFAVASQMRDFIKKLLNAIEQVKGASPPLFSGMQELISSRLKDIQKQLDMMVKYNWDFENYLEEDVPAAMEYIRTQSKPKDGKLLAIGHSMGGILLYATLSRCCFEGRDSGLASIATLGASLDFASSRSSFKMFLPLVDPAQALDVSMIPIGALVSALHPFATRLPYASSWYTQISAPDMMQPELLEKLLLQNFGSVPSNLLAQLTTVFQEQGLCNRNGTLFYKDHVGKSKVPILALAGDHDLICPPEAVYETAKLIHENLITYKVFGEPGGPHYAHYDMVGSRLARYTVYPCIVEFLNRHDVA